MAITISGENNNDKILASDGVIDQISGINIVGLITASHINVGSNIQLGNAGIITATTFVGNVTGNVNSTSPLLLQTGGSERFRITGNNELGIAGANYGSSGQVLTSGGSGSAVSWATPAVTAFTNGSNNRVVTATSGSGLNGEANLTFDGNYLVIHPNGSGIGIGTVSPTAPIHLHKASGDAIQKIESSNGAAVLDLRHTNGYGYINYRQDGAETFRVGQIAQFTSYSVYNPNSSLPYQLCVEGNGEVGINTHNPGNTLHLLRNTNHGISLQKGGTNPGSALIQVASYGALNLEASNNLTLKSGGSQQIFFNRGSTENARFDTGSRFLIGHTSNIAVAGLNSRVQITGTSDSDAHLSIRNFSANTNGAILSLAKSRGSVGAYTAVQDDDVLGQINFAGADGTDLAEVAGKITVACDAAVASNRIPSRMEFHTTDGNGTLDLNMVITRDGHLYLPQGITRDAMFNLAHNSANDFVFGRTTGNADTGMTIVTPSATSGFINFADADGQRQGSIVYQHGSGSDKMFFRTNNNQTGLIIDSGQKVLIGDPSANIYASYGGKLQVSNTNFAMNSFANNQHAQTLLFAKSRATSGSGGSIVGSGDFCGHIEWYADDGVDTQNQIAKISGQMDGTPGANDTPGKLLFYTTVDGANAASERMTISSGGVVHIGSTAVSNTIPTGGLDLQGNNTNCVVEMGNPLPNYSAGRVPTFRIKTRDTDKAVDFSSMWGGDNGIWKHVTFAGGATIFYNGTNDTEIVRITGSALMVGTTSDSVSTQAAGISLNNDAAIVSRRNGVMQYYKSIATGGYYANVFMSANTTVGSIFFNSGGTQFNTSSDYRRKENVVSLTDGISKLKQLKPYRFNFKDNPSVTVDGFLAHEAQEIVPHTVTGTKDQVSTSNDVAVGIASTVGEPIYQQMDLSKLVPLLTAALQDEISKREALEARVAALESS